MISNDNHFNFYENGTLSILSVRNSDKGKYECVASNGLDKPLEKIINLQVHGKE